MKASVDQRYHDIRETIATEAAGAYYLLGGEQNVDTVMWETMLVAAERNRLLKRLVGNPGVFMAAIYNTYGENEFLSWRSTVQAKIDELHPRAA